MKPFLYGLPRFFRKGEIISIKGFDFHISSCEPDEGLLSMNTLFELSFKNVGISLYNNRFMNLVPETIPPKDFFVDHPQCQTLSYPNEERKAPTVEKNKKTVGRPDSPSTPTFSQPQTENSSAPRQSTSENPPRPPGEEQKESHPSNERSSGDDQVLPFLIIL